MSLFVDRLVSYVEACGARGFGARLRGASPEDIRRLEDAARLRVPPAYREFLERMGNDAGGLGFDDVCDSSISTVLDSYREIEEGRLPFPEGLLLFASVFEAQLALDCRRPGEPPVVRWSEVPGRQVAPSFEALCWASAFEHFRFRAFPRGRCVDAHGPANVLPRVAAAAERLGFRPEAFSRPDLLMAARPDAALMAAEPEPGRVWVYPTTDTFERADELVASLLAGSGAVADPQR